MSQRISYATLSAHARTQKMLDDLLHQVVDCTTAIEKLLHCIEHIITAEETFSDDALNANELDNGWY